MKFRPSALLTLLAIGLMAHTSPAPASQPEHEPAYVDGKIVTITAIFFKQLNAPPQAQADFYLVAYPFQPVNWDDLGLAPPICNPCDHFGDGVDPLDFHDHVLDSMPANPGHGEFRPLWHLFIAQPAYNGDPVHDQQVSLAYAAQLPAKSEAAVESLLDSTLPDGSAVAVKADTQFYFLCAVVNANAAK